MTARDCLAGCLLGLSALQSQQQVQVWRSDVVLWEQAVRVAPCLVRPHIQLAFAEAKAGHGDAAMQEWAEAVLVTKAAGCAR